MLFFLNEGDPQPDSYLGSKITIQGILVDYVNTSQS